MNPARSIRFLLRHSRARPVQRPASPQTRVETIDRAHRAPERYGPRLWHVALRRLLSRRPAVLCDWRGRSDGATRVAAPTADRPAASVGIELLALMPSYAWTEINGTRLSRATSREARRSINPAVWHGRGARRLERKPQWRRDIALLAFAGEPQLCGRAAIHW